ncbi:hypothetical protein BJF83_18610 [Nocardiopsis sp. CNR-923]|nr:hypothetical protein BJF83_18610 [Nocardiopsis sp. CNR-923]
MGVDAAEQREQLCALVGAERGHDALVDLVEDPVELGQAAFAVVGDGDDVAAPVVRVGGAADPAAVGEVVEDRHEIALVDPGAAGERRLAGGAELGQGGEHHEVVLVGSHRAERLPRDAPCLDGCHSGQARELAPEPLRGLLAVVESQFVARLHADTLSLLH